MNRQPKGGCVLATQPPKSKSISPRKSKFPRTDLGNGELLASLYKGRLCFDHSRKKWFIFSKHWWVEDLDGLSANESQPQRHPQ